MPRVLSWAFTACSEVRIFSEVSRPALRHSSTIAVWYSAGRLSKNFVPLDFGVIPASLDEGAIDVGVVGSTDGRLADPDTGWVLLEDDQQMLAADNIFPLASEELTDAYGDDLSTVLDGISAELTTEELTELNKRFDVDKEDADAIAESWLADHGIGGA